MFSTVPAAFSADDANVVDTPVTDVCTNSVVAICVVFVPAVAVGAVGTSVNAGDARGAYAAVSSDHVSAAVLRSSPEVPASAAMAVRSASAACAPISASDHDTAAEPLTALPVAPMVRVLEVPHREVVMFAEPLKLVPLIVRAVCKAVAVPAFPVMLPEGST